MEVNYGVPTASMQTDSFVEAVEAVAYANGMPRQRFVYIPQPVMGKTNAELRAYVDGNSPVTGRPVTGELPST